MLVENRPMEIGRGNPSVRRGSERSLFQTEGFLPLSGVAKLDARYIVHWHLSEMHIAARHVDAAGERMQNGYRAVGLGGIGVLLKTSPGVMSNRPVVPKQPCCFPDGFWLHSGYRRGVLPGHRAAPCSEKLKGRTAADRPFKGIDDEFTRDGETTRCLTVSALSDVIGNRRSARFVPSDKTTGLTLYGQDVGAEQRAVVIPNQKRAVRPIPHELGIEPALIDHDPGDCQRDGCVSSRSNSEPAIGFDGEPDAARIDDNQFGSPRPGIRYLGRSGDKRGAGIVPPQ